MDCLTIGLALALVVLLGFSTLGLVLEQPAMTWGFGYLALAGSIPLLWLLLNQPIRRRYGSRGTRAFNRLLATVAIVELALPAVLFFAAGALAAESNPAITVPLLFFFNLACLAVSALWWQGIHRT